MTLTPTEVAEIKIAVLERDAIIKKLQSEIAKLEARVVCPICKDRMVPVRWEYHDTSGWAFGWLCACDDEIRENKDKTIR